MSLLAFYTQSAPDFMHQTAVNFENRFNERRVGVVDRLINVHEMTEEFNLECKSFLKKITNIFRGAVVFALGSFFSMLACLPNSIPLAILSGAICISSAYVYYLTDDKMSKLQVHLIRVRDNAPLNLLNITGDVWDGRVLSRVY